MTIKFSCTSCSKNLEVKQEYAGKKIKCPACKTVLVVPSELGPSTKKSNPIKVKKRKCNVKCNDCGSTFSDIEWSPDTVCLGCQSKNFFPVVKSEEDVEDDIVSAAKTSISTIRRKPKKVKRDGVDFSMGWKKSPLVGVALIVVILGMWIKMGVDMVSDTGNRPKIDMMCSECDAEVRAEIPRGAQPWECPECGQNSLYAAMQCENHHHFPLKPLKLPEIDMSCPKCGAKMVYDGDAYSSGMLVCSAQFAEDGTPGCSGHIPVLTYYCYTDGNVWVVLPDKNGKLKEAKKCPKCGSKDFVSFYNYQPRCPECGSTDLRPITPYKRHKK